MEWLGDPQIWISLLTLTFLEVVLGIDNIVFISILADKLPQERQSSARRIGLSLAIVTRLLLLFTISILAKLTTSLFTVFEHAISGRDLILIAGGMFLLFKSTHEIHSRLEGEDGTVSARTTHTFSSVIIQIMLLDVVFSLDSIITAVGLVDEISVMVAAILIALGIMLLLMNVINDFIDKHPTIKMLALSFLLLIGVALVTEGLDHGIPKGYIYFAMAFSMMVEILNIQAKKKKQRQKKIETVRLHKPYS